MIFTSFDFLLFFSMVLVVQRVLPHAPRNLFLVVTSCLFYAFWDWRFLGLLWLTVLTDYTVSHLLARTETASRRRLLLGLSLGTNLGVLAFFKFAGFFANSLRAALAGIGVAVPEWPLHVLLPVGISFYTFQSMSYTIDVYRGHLKPLPSLVDFALYVTLFPQLVAGPIERGTHLARQVVRKHVPSREDVHHGAWLILKGLFKKAVLADNLAPVVDGVFSSAAPTGVEVLLGVYAFAFQIYGDFSGYTDIARGVARWLGYDLMLNFRLPYFAVSPGDFWRRWHISLSSWLRDYLYIPLGGSRGGTVSTYRNLVVTMLLGGLWHGAAWTFVAWGAYQGLVQAGYRAASARLESWGIDLGAARVGSGRWVVQVFVMFHVTCLGWLLFRAESVGQVVDMMSALFGGYAQPSAAFWESAWLCVLLCAPVVLVQLCEELSGSLNFVRGLSLAPRSAVYAATAGAILTLGNFGGREFIYFQF